MARERLFVLIVFLGILLVGGAPSTSAQELTVEGYSLGGPPGAAVRTLNDRVSLLVYLTSEESGAAARQGLRDFAAQAGGWVQYEYEILPNVVNVRGIGRDRLEGLKRLPGVAKVVEDTLVHASLNTSVPLIRGMQNQIAAAGMTADGEGVRVCIIDTGINHNHIMFEDRIDTAAGFDFVNNDSDPEDDEGHGSNVAGIAAAGDGFTVNFGCGGPEDLQGVAPEATLIAVKVLAANGSGFTSDVVAGIDHCASPTLPGGPADVINLSLGSGAFGGTCDGDATAESANNAVDAGVVVVAAAGNEGNTAALSSPACASKVIAVGATYDEDFPSCNVPQTTFVWCTQSIGENCVETCTDVGPDVDDLVCFSNQSVNLDVTAPGCVIFSASDGPGTTGLSGLCGTSQASPHVVGLAALLLDVDPSLTPEEIRQGIRDGAIDLGKPGFDVAYGHGRIDVLDTLENRCGNGLVEGAEECDDGNALPGDNCTDCMAGFCPNSQICSGGCEPTSNCFNNDTGADICSTLNQNLIACDPGETIHVNVCSCEAPPGSGGNPNGGNQNVNQGGNDPSCGQNVTWSCR